MDAPLIPPPAIPLVEMLQENVVGGGMTSAEKAHGLETIDRSVVAPRTDTQRVTAGLSSFFLFAQVQSAGVTQWGRAPKLRDIELRDFWHTEHYLASAVGIVSARNAASSWTVTGDEATAEAAQAMLNNANFGAGWEDFTTKLSIDLYTQDSGAFVELVRAADSPDSPVIGINTLDAARCFPTGNPEEPVIYEDREGKFHRMKWYQVVQLLEMPAPKVPDFGGMFWRLQYCAVTRLLRAADILKSISILKDEKVSGRFTRAVHLVRGITSQEISDAVRQHSDRADAQGLQRYILPVIVGSVDVEADVGHDTIEMATLPENFDESETIKNYILAISMAFLTDYQEFAPLPGGNLGTSAQSEILHQKARGKGPGLWRQIMTRLMNQSGVLPANVEFAFDEPDIEAEQEQALVAKTRAETREIMVRTGELDGDTARQMAVDVGDISEPLFEAMGGVDLTPETTIESEEPTGLRTITPEDPVPDGPWLLPDSDQMWTGLVHRMEDGTFETGGLPSDFDAEVVVVPWILESLAARLLVDTKAQGDRSVLDILISRLHRAFTVAADDMRALGIMDTAERISISGLIGKVLTAGEDILDGEAHDVMQRNLDAEDARSLVMAAKAVTDSQPQSRAGPDEERLDFEEEVAADIGKGLSAARRLVNERLRREDEEADGFP